MRSRSILRRRFFLHAGLALTAAVLAPGAARAEEPAPPAPACMEKAGGASTCEVQEGQAERPRGLRSQADATRMQERLRAELLADGEPPVVLNSRGYNYDAPRDPGLEAERLLREARQQRREAQPQPKPD